MKISKKFQNGGNLKGKILLNSTTEDNIIEAPLIYLSVLPRENPMTQIKNCHGAVQSNNAFFAGFNHMKFWQGFYLLTILVNHNKYTLDCLQLSPRFHQYMDCYASERHEGVIWKKIKKKLKNFKNLLKLCYKLEIWYVSTRPI